MRKFLYITDQEEYSEHSFIGPLFEKYLNEHFDTTITYFSKFKDSVEVKNKNKIIIPKKLKKTILNEIEKTSIDLNDFDFIAVRNSATILKEVLQKKNIYKYKVAFRLSFPKRIAKIQTDKANNKINFIDSINNKLQIYSETNLINKCDIFLPTSRKMRDDYLKNVKTRTFIIPSAIDPEFLSDNIQHEGNEKRFFYAGTLDKLREFETILKAFKNINKDSFKIMISTKDPIYTKEMLINFPELKDNVELFEPKTKQDLLLLIAKADIGLSILPDIELFNSSTPVKVLDYYSSAIPCIMSKNENNTSIFNDNESAWFSEFDESSIQDKLKYIISLTKDEIAQVGIQGQKRLLDIRNYKRIAADLAHQLNIL